MTTKLYFHDATTADTGILPSTIVETNATPTVTATGAATNRAMDTTAGATVVGATLASTASTTFQANWFRRWVSAPLAAQTLGSTSVHWLFSIAGKTSNPTYSPWYAGLVCVSVWRPSTGAAVYRWNGAGVTTPTAGSFGSTLLNASGGSSANANLLTFTCQDGDILVLEFFGYCTQSMATGYTWTLYYDGTTDDSIISNAAYLISPTTLLWSTGSTPNSDFMAFF